MPILLKNGIVLQHKGDEVVPRKADILIDRNVISRISPNITPPESAEVYDCTDKIISPGFIDTHRHTWQTQLKGRHANHLFKDYMLTGNLAASLYSPDDVYIGELGGALEGLTAGTTTVVDFAHCVYSEAHVRAAYSGLVASGTRAYFCPGLNKKAKSWHPFEFDLEGIPEWFMPLLAKLQDSNPRIKIGLGFDRFDLSREEVRGIYGEARELGLRPITSHSVPHWNAAQFIMNLGLMKNDVLLVHVNRHTNDQLKAIKVADACISSTPSTELQMEAGSPICFGPMEYHCSLGVDCHSWTSASMVSEMRIVIQAMRARHGEKVMAKGQAPSAVGVRVEQAFNLATLQGAKAVGEPKLGQIRNGFLADLVVWDALSPGMVCAAEHDPVAAVIMHSSISDVDMVIVDGVIRKNEGKLVPIKNNYKYLESAGDEIQWRDVAKALLASRGKIQRKVDKIDYEKAAKDSQLSSRHFRSSSLSTESITMSSSDDHDNRRSQSTSNTSFDESRWSPTFSKS